MPGTHHPARRSVGRPTPAFAARSLLVLLVATSLGAFAQPADWPHPSEIEAPPLTFDAPEPVRAVLSNGIVVHLAEDRTLPLVSGVAYVEAPGLYDPDDLAGLAGFTAALLREGGAGGRSPATIDVTLERLAASVEASSSDVLASVSFSALSDTLDQVVPIWRDVLVAPGFDPERIEVQRSRQLEAIRRVVDDPVQLAVREFQRRIAGDHPAGRYPTEATIGAIERSDLVAFHRAYYGPKATVLAVAGDFDAERMLARLEREFGGWEVDVAAPPELPAYDPEPERRIYLAQKDLQQSIVLVGQPAMVAYQGPYSAFTVANDVLGAGGFGSRLFSEIRTRRGLAYATGSQLTQGFEVPGTFLAYAFTRVDATAEVLGLLLAEIDRLRDEGVTQAELERSVTTLVNSSVFRDVSVAAVAERAARVELLGLPGGYFARHVEAMQALAPGDVQAAARQVVDPAHLVILVVGDEAAFDRPLDEFGPVERIEIE
ncbi:MAG: pitrilysin family protein [Trueperaceae bacterium]|nr:pitrilysin family protein [Trueperaceae bacterium]